MNETVKVKLYFVDFVFLFLLYFLSLLVCDIVLHVVRDVRFFRLQ